MNPKETNLNAIDADNTMELKSIAVSKRIVSA